MTENWLAILLSSALVSALISGITTYSIEKRKYKQEYWKITIEKRLDTYEKIEKVLTYFQSVHLINDKPCHLAFLDIEIFDALNSEMGLITWKRNWISSSLFKKIIELNRLFLELNSLYEPSNEQISSFGTENYVAISTLRDNMLKIMARDYLNMSKVEDFFKSKVIELENKNI